MLISYLATRVITLPFKSLEGENIHVFLRKSNSTVIKNNVNNIMNDYLKLRRETLYILGLVKESSYKIVLIPGTSFEAEFRYFLKKTHKIFFFLKSPDYQRDLLKRNKYNVLLLQYKIKLSFN